MELADPWHYHGTQGAHCFAIQATAVVPRRSAALDVCVWPPPLQRQLAETPHRRHLIANFRVAGMKLENGGNWVFSTILLCGRRTDDRTRLSLGRFRVRQTSPAAETGRHFASEIPSSQLETRNPNRSPAPEGSHGPRSSPEPFSAGRMALFAGIIDRALHHWGHVPVLDGEPGDHDFDDSETDTAIPDDHDDIVSPATCTCESVWPSSLWWPGFPPSEWG